MSEDIKTVSEAYAWSVKKLSGGGIEAPEAEAEFLLTHILGVKRHRLFTEGGRALTKEEYSRLAPFIERRLKREPAQYIAGSVEFRNLTLKVTGAVLIPRPETELLLDEAKEAVKSGKAALKVLDLCTGSGCIAISAAKEMPGSMVYATDISNDALEIARENAAKNGAEVEFLRGDLFEPLKGRGLEGAFDIILSNPPYIPQNEIGLLAPEVREHEPHQALSGGPDGLLFIKRILSESTAFLASGGSLIMEIGCGQAETVLDLSLNTGRYTGARIINDYSGIGRIFIASVG